jgi:hypothetical protein
MTVVTTKTATAFCWIANQDSTVLGLSLSLFSCRRFPGHCESHDELALPEQRIQFGSSFVIPRWRETSTLWQNWILTFAGTTTLQQVSNFATVPNYIRMFGNTLHQDPLRSNLNV